MVIAAIEHGGTQAYLALFNENGEFVANMKPVRLDLPNVNRGWSSNENLPQKTVEIIHRKVDELCASNNLDGIDAIGYSSPGPVTKDRILVRAPNVWGSAFLNVEYRKLLEEAFDLPGRVALVNDITAAAEGFMRFAPPEFKERENFCIIAVSTGIGSKCVFNGKVLLGSEGLAGEIGHIPILHEDEVIPGHRCGCGGIYCLEAGSSGNANALRAYWEAKKSLKNNAFPQSADLIHDILNISVSPGPSYSDNLKKINVWINKAAHIGDPFSLHVLNKSIRPLARAIAITEVQHNPGKFYMIGSFALNLGMFQISSKMS